MRRIHGLILIGAGGLMVVGLLVPVRWSDPLLPPDGRYLLGTDAFGRDFLPYLLRSASLTIGWAALSTLMALTAGTLSGLLLGFSRGRWVRLADRILDVLLALPGLLLALAVLSLFNRGLFQIALAVGLALIPVVARVTYGMAQTIRSAGYIEAAAVSGGGLLWVISFHAWPVLSSQIARFTGVVFAWAVLNIAALDFLGFYDPGVGRTLGGVIAEARRVLRVVPLLVVLPSLLLTVLISSFWFLFMEEWPLHEKRHRR